MPRLPASQQEQKLDSAKKLGISQKQLDDMDAIPMPASQASEMATGNVGGDPASYTLPEIDIPEQAPETPLPSHPVERPAFLRDIAQAPVAAKTVNGRPSFLDEIPPVKSPIQESYEHTVQHAPDADYNAKVLSYADKTGQPPAFVDKNFKDVEKAATAPSPDIFANMEAKYPGSTKFYAQPENMARAHDDIPNVLQHEAAVQTMREAQSKYDEFISGYQSSSWGMTARQAVPNITMPKDAGWIDRQVQGAGQLLGDLPMMIGAGAAGTLVGGPVVGAGVGFGAPAAYKEALREKLEGKAISPLKVGVEGGKQFVVGIASTLAGMGGTALAEKLLVSTFGEAAAKSLIANTVKTGTALTSESAAMEVAGKGVEGEKPTLQGAADNLITVGALHGVHHVNDALVHKAVEIEKTKTARDFYTALGDTAEASKVRARMPEEYKAHIEELTKDGPVEHVYIPVEAANAYFQSKGLDPAQVMQDLGAGAAYAEAKQTGESIKIPLADWVEKGSKYYKDFANDVKFDPDAKTPNELEALHKDQLEKMTAMEEERKNGKPAAKDESAPRPVYDDARQKLLDAGMSEAEATHAATLHEQTINTLAKRFGITPEEMAKRAEFSVSRKEHGAATSIEPLPEPTGMSPEDAAVWKEAAQQGRGDLLQMAKRALENIPDVSADAVAEALGLKKEAVRLLGWKGRRKGHAVETNYSKEDILAAAGEGSKTEGDHYNQSQPEKQSAPAFYSKLTKTVEQKMGGSASVEQINGMLKEIKPEERKWSGLDEFLKGKQKVGKEELLDFLRGNALEIKEITKSEAKAVSELPEGYTVKSNSAGTVFNIFGPEGRLLGRGGSEEEARQDALSTLTSDETHPATFPKFSQYTLPGGENYREVLMTLPPKEGASSQASVPTDQSKWTVKESTPLSFGDQPKASPKNLFQTKVDGEGVSIWHDPSAKIDRLYSPKFQNYDINKYLEFPNHPTFESAAADLQQALRRFHEESAARKENYRSSHWDEPNILAFTRLNDRVDSQGKKVLFAEEIQSDWHQEGRKKGYKDSDPEAIDKLKEQRRAIEEKMDAMPAGASAELLAEHSAITDKLIEQQKGVPDAPFRKTWHEFVLKRLIREAAEKGYDKLAWTTGEQQAERYDLSKQVDEVQAKKNKDGTYKITVIKGDSVLEDVPSVQESALEAQLGKDLAAKIIAQEGKETVRGSKIRSYTGVDLKVGGEGMKGFYDKILPEFANKFGKKYGAKVSETALDSVGKFSKENITASRSNGGKWEIKFDDGVVIKYPETKVSRLEDAQQKAIEKRNAEEGSAGVKVHSLEITPAMRDAALNEGFSLFQGDQAPRGRIVIGDKQFSIDLFKGADKSTFLHESGHMYLEVMKHLAQDENAPEQIKKDYAEIEKYLGVEAGGNLETEHHETWARSFEAYLREGKAPSEALRTAFAKFRTWLTHIYKQVTSLGVELTPEVRGVMDRMLATDEEIHRAALSSGYEIAVPEGLHPDVANKIIELQAKAKEQAVTVLLKEQMKELSKDHQKVLKEERAKQTEIAKEKVKTLPVFQAIEDIKGGPDGEGKRNAFKLAEKGMRGELTPEESAHFEATAEIHGFADGHDLAEKIIQSRDEKQFDAAVKGLVDEAMLPHADLKDSSLIREKAMEAIHNERSTELLALEKEALDGLVKDATSKLEESKRKRNDGKANAEAVKLAAKELLGNKTIKDSGNYRVYVTAERNAAVRASKALAKKDYAAASKAKGEQLMNHALAAEAMKNRTEIAKTLKAVQKFSGRGGDMLGMPYGTVRQIDQILKRFGLGENKPEDAATMTKIAKDMAQKGEPASDIADKTGFRQDQAGRFVPETISDYVARMQDNYFAVSLPESVMNGAERPYKDLTLKELRDVKDSVQAMAKLGKYADANTDAERKGSIKEQAALLKVRIAETYGTPFADSLLPGSSHDSKRAEMLTAISLNLPGQFTRMLDNISTTCRKLDGLKDGPAQDNISRPLHAAADREIERTHKAVKEVEEIFAKHYEPGEFAKYKDTRIKLSDGRVFTKEEILSMGLNWGNEGNKQRLMDGFQFSEAKMKELFSHLGKNDWHFIQDTWDHIDKYWPEIVKLEMDMNGSEPGKVQAAPFTNEHGMFRGGYYPIAYDMEKSADAFKNAQSKDALFKQYSTAKAATEQGHTEARSATVTRPISLSLDVLKNHHEDVIHDLEFRRAVIDVSRFLNQRDTKAGIVNALGVRGYAGIQEWLKDAASPRSEPMTMIDKAARWFRFKTTMFTMSYNLLSAPKIGAENVVNLSSEVGMSGAARALANYWRPELMGGDRAGIHETVMKLSPFMHERASHLDRDQADITDSARGQKQSAFKRFAFGIHAILDQSVSIPLWNDIYTREMGQHGNEKRAVMKADEAVRRTFMSGTKTNQAKAMRGPETYKALTVAYGYQSMMWQRYSEGLFKTGMEWRQGDKIDALGTMARTHIYTFAMPALVVALSRELMRNGPTTDSERKKRMAVSMLEEASPLKFIPLLRDVSAAATKAAMGEHSRSFQSTPLEGAVDTLLRPLSDLHGNHDHLLEHSVNSMSFLAGVPKSTNNLIFNFIDWQKSHGELAWRDAMSRRAKK